MCETGTAGLGTTTSAASTYWMMSSGASTTSMPGGSWAVRAWDMSEGWSSTTVTSHPCSASRRAADTPAAPRPMTSARSATDAGNRQVIGVEDADAHRRDDAGQDPEPDDHGR